MTLLVGFLCGAVIGNVLAICIGIRDKDALAGDLFSLLCAGAVIVAYMREGAK